MTPTGVYYALPTSTQIIQRKARHKKVETTLRCDHVSDDMVREYFEKQQSKPKLTDVNYEQEEKQESSFGYV